jgi:Zn finger protein HypA/HybF involved in hydrogenase expression
MNGLLDRKIMEKYIKFSCETCDHKIKTLIKNAGKMGNCPKCRTLCFIPDENDGIEIVEILKDLEEIGQGEGLK